MHFISSNQHRNKSYLRQLSLSISASIRFREPMIWYRLCSRLHKLHSFFIVLGTSHSRSDLFSSQFFSRWSVVSHFLSNIRCDIKKNQVSFAAVFITQFWPFSTSFSVRNLVVEEDLRNASILHSSDVT